MTVKTEDQIKKTLLDKGVVNKEQLSQAEKIQGENGQSLIDVLVSLGFVTPEIVAQITAEGKPRSIDLSKYNVNPNAVTAFTEEIARKYWAIPIDFDGESLVVAMADPADIFVLDDLKIVSGYEITPVRCKKQEVEEAINRYYKMEEVVREEIEEALGEGETEEEVAVEEITEEAPVIKLANLIVTQAIRDGASDIHVEPQEKDLRIRYRIDGVLHETMRSPKRIQAALTSRYKIMGGMDVAERRKPQDGHFGLTVGEKAYDFRVATLPTIYGERVALRILEKESILMELDDLGFLPESLERFKKAFSRPYGAILVTGPTGSGKSTTLYATLNVLNSPKKNIVTIEDPVEYRLPGINQIQVSLKSGLTFSKGLRAILRTSPDILMVGEIRDKETAQIAIEAALTGHLVLSTLHTNDAPSALTRLTEMGIPPFLTSSAIVCVQAQRLARRLCKKCKQSYKAAPELLKQFGLSKGGGKSATFYRPCGCKVCKNTGYKGRIGIYEIMPISEEIASLTVGRATSDEIREVAISEGMTTLKEDGFKKAELGITSLEEVLRVVA